MGRILHNTSNWAIVLDKKIGRGGEGEIWTVVGLLKTVAKIYFPQKLSPEKELKLRTMIENPPADDMRTRYNHISIAWPTDLLYEQNKFVGYLMPLIPKYPTALEIYNPRRRRQTYPEFNWKYLHRAAYNLAVSMEAIHARGYVIGDLNESNIFISNQALISLVDTDSFQVTTQSGHVFRCPVGKPEYTSPELQGVDFRTVNRTIYHDYFSLAVMNFLLLMNGTHPFAGVLANPHLSIGRVELYCIKHGFFPFHPKTTMARPSPNSLDIRILSNELQFLFTHCFVNGHHNPLLRPTPQMWQKALDRAEKNLIPCRINPTHYYAKHLANCPWCKTPKKVSYSRPKSSSHQKPMPSASFLSSQLHHRQKVTMPSMSTQPLHQSSLRGTGTWLNPKNLLTLLMDTLTSKILFLGNTNKPSSLLWKIWIVSVIPLGVAGIFIGVIVSSGILLIFIDPEITSGLAGIFIAIATILLTGSLARIVDSGRGFIFFTSLFIAYWLGSSIASFILSLLTCYQSSFAGVVLIFGGLGVIGGIAIGNLIALQLLQQAILKILAITMILAGILAGVLILTNAFHLAFQPINNCHVHDVDFEFWLQFFGVG